MNDQKNVIIAVIASAAIFAGWHFFYEAPRQAQIQEQIRQEQALKEEAQPQDLLQSQASTVPATPKSRDDIVTSTQRIAIDTPSLRGSIRLQGGRLDDLTLKNYRVTQDADSDQIILLSPSGTEESYFVDFGWISADTSIKMPNSNTVWSTSSSTLTVENPVTLSWNNGQGLTFIQEISVDKDYLFTVKQSVQNASGRQLNMQSFGLVSRSGEQEGSGFAVLHEGPIGYLNDKLEEVDYSDIQEDKLIARDSKGGWLGITDKYWLTALIPDQSLNHKANFRDDSTAKGNRYQVDFLTLPQAVNDGATYTATTHLFAGAKVLEMLDGYEHQLGVKHLDKAVDFGWFYFITKPLFYALDFLQDFLGNFGLAILLLTVILKILFFPLANKSFRSMAKMKKLQPEMERIRKVYADDRMRMNTEVMELYKKEKVNPMAGCLPMLIQIPVFFALYKVLFISIEMRHAPFYGWIQDLSAPDPTSVFNLFGLIPWDPPSFLMLGAWPLMMGLSMFLQQKLNPAPTDPAQAKVFMIMPIVFTFMLASFPAGLVIYWTWNNVLSMAQQYTIMKMPEKKA